MENYNENIQYAPIILCVLAFIFRNKLFVTPTQLQKNLREICKEIEEKYVTRRECAEHKGNTEKRLDELIKGVNDIKNYLMSAGKR